MAATLNATVVTHVSVVITFKRYTTMLNLTNTMPTTLMLFILVGENIIGLSECVTYYYFDDARMSHVCMLLLDKCDGTCYDQCTDKQRRRLDVLFEIIETGLDEGWAVKQSDVVKTIVPEGFGTIRRIVTVTAIP